MTEQHIRIKIRSAQYAVSDELVCDLLDYAYGDGDCPACESGCESAIALNAHDGLDEYSDTIELYTEGLLQVTKESGRERVEISYEETELTGMAGARTSVSFDTATPRLVSMTRSGAVSTALVFEPGRRNICAYNTAYLPFELCVATRIVENTIDPQTCGGALYLDYIIEIRGGVAERNKFTMEIKDACSFL